jgi:hypothetical protein
MSGTPVPVAPSVAPVRGATMLDVGAERLASLLRALGYSPSRVREAVNAFTRFSESWAELRPGTSSIWPSDVTDDHTPFEFSVALDRGEPEVRALIEVQAGVPSIEGNWASALATTRRWAESYGMDLRHLRKVEDLFAPTRECPRFAFWHGITFSRSGAPEFKVYLNPQARGPTGARGLVVQAMNRLGFAGCVDHFPAAAGDRDVPYFALDLSAAAHARAKVYFAHPGANAAEIEAAVAGVPGHVSGRAADFCRSMLHSTGPFDARPLLTCLSFVAGAARPSAATVHVPVRSYVATDQAIRQRVEGVLPPDAAALYRRALEAFTRRPLSFGAGMQTYVSLRTQTGRITVYLATESNRRAA